MFDRLGTFVSRRWLLVLLGWVALAALIGWTAPRWEDVTHDGDFAYLPAEMTSVRGNALLKKNFTASSFKSQIVLVLSRGDGELRSADYEVADRLLLRLRSDIAPREEVAAIWSYADSGFGDKLTSPVRANGQALLIMLQLRSEFMAIDNMPLLERVYDILEDTRGGEDFPPGLRLGVTGSASVGYDMLRAAEQSIKNTELTTIILVVLILLLVYRAPGLVVVPLATIVVSVVVSMHLVALMTQLAGQVDLIDFKVFKTTRIFIVVILFGAGTDYCLFLISRYREELRRGLPPREAVGRALGHVGDALAASALTTIVGLGMMFFADFGKFSNSGPAIAVCLVVALAACLTLAPALLAATGRIVFWPFGGKLLQTDKSDENAADSPDEDTEEIEPGSHFGRLWQRIGRAVITRPGLILVVSLILLVPLVVEGFSVPITYDLLHELDPGRPSVRGTALLRNHFNPGETGPIVVLARLEEGTFDTPEGRGRIARLTKDLLDFSYAGDDGKSVRPFRGARSLANPLGGRTGGSFLYRIAARVSPAARRFFLSQTPPDEGRIARFDLVLQTDPFARESIEALDHLQEQLRAKAADPLRPGTG